MCTGCECKWWSELHVRLRSQNITIYLILIENLVNSTHKLKTWCCQKDYVQKNYSSFLPVPCPTRSVFSKIISDQFAFRRFRPTGSTTAVLNTLLQHLTDLVTQYGYVHLIALDFSKAFDTVRYSTLLSKIADLQIDDQLYNWLVDFFSNRQHLTKHNQEASAILSINSSVVQRSGMGPVMYIVAQCIWSTSYLSS